MVVSHRRVHAESHDWTLRELADVLGTGVIVIVLLALVCCLL